MKKKTISTIVKVIVTLAILAFLFLKVEFNLSGFQSTLMSVDLPVYLMSLFGVIIVLGIKSYRWKILVGNEGHRFKSSRAFGAYMASDAIGIITPGRIGEIARLYYVRQESSISFFKAFKTIVSDRIFDFTMLGWFGASGMTYYFKSFGPLPGYMYVLIILGMILLGYVAGIAFLRLIVKRNWFPRWQIPQFAYECFMAVIGKKSVFLWTITMVAYIAYFFFSWLIMHSLQVRTGVVDVAFIMSIMSLSTIIPVSIAGFGTREATLVALFSYYSLSPEIAVSFSLLHFSAFFLWGGLIGLVFWLVMPISLKQVKDDSLLLVRLFKVQPENVTETIES